MEQAIWKPVEGAHSIWELVCHLLFYEKRILLRFLGETANEPKAETNDATYRLPTETFQNWKETKQEYFSVHRELEKILAKSELEDLYRPIPDDNPLVLELKSLAMHNDIILGKLYSSVKCKEPGQGNAAFKKASLALHLFHYQRVC
ncbi:DinB family protein [Bacillus subtilis]|uniref:DinB family protein n=1 Tax=Bacillus subtilis TaxID=1423 RepID=UPI0020B3B34A|nr:DinB family protein [Bacillus subtilis]